jgi:hypothetical protein
MFLFLLLPSGLCACISSRSHSSFLLFASFSFESVPFFSSYSSCSFSFVSPSSSNSSSSWSSSSSSSLDEVIRRSTDPDWWRRIYDQYAGEYRTLTSDDLDLINRIRTGRVALRDFQLYQPFRETPDPIHKIHPVTNFIRSKGGFIPSKARIYRVQKFIAEIRRLVTLTKRRTSTNGRHHSMSSRSAAGDAWRRSSSRR